MRVYRLAMAKFAQDFSGNGAAKYGGRWNNREVPALYTSTSKSLTALELLVHAHNFGFSADFQFISFEFEDALISHRWKSEELPLGWNSVEDTRTAANWGTKYFMKLGALALKVPSTVIEDEYNVVFNPLHPDFSHLKMIDIQPFTFDSKLLKT